MQVGYTAATLIVLVGFGLGEPDRAAAAAPYRLGAIFSITGPESALGDPEARTARMVIEEVNAAGGVHGRRVQLILVDDQGIPEKAAAAARGLVERDGVSAILGPSLSGSSLAVRDYTEEVRVPVISCAAAGAIVEPVARSHWTFKTAPDNRLVAERLAQHLRQAGLTRVGLLAADDAFGRDGAGNFRSAAEAAGLTIRYDATYALRGALEPVVLPEGAIQDLTAAALNSLVVWGTTYDSAAVARAVRGAGVPGALFFSHGVASREFLALAGEAVQGTAFPAGKALVADQLPPGDPQQPVIVEYLEEYRLRYGQEPNTFGGHAFDAVSLAIRALREAGPGREAIREFLEGIDGYAGVSGVFRYSADDHAGLGPDSLVMVRIRGNAWVLEP